eukprot:TRINITY_DN8480_c0_g1_i2.p1 TRINITY_DN8480_c0_g1~~TRINITY_DN8480_c0_g1_i2.p1  ORF type:complete len:165 (+),score=10.98 TRINITY_DN8480_c0_g1_i2:75-569(+)
MGFLSLPLEVIEIIADFTHTSTLSTTCTVLWHLLRMRHLTFRTDCNLELPASSQRHSLKLSFNMEGEWVQLDDIMGYNSYTDELAELCRNSFVAGTGQAGGFDNLQQLQLDFGDLDDDWGMKSHEDQQLVAWISKQWLSPCCWCLTSLSILGYDCMYLPCPGYL